LNFTLFVLPLPALLGSKIEIEAVSTNQSSLDDFLETQLSMGPGEIAEILKERIWQN
jgi:hypothetical protein